MEAITTKAFSTLLIVACFVATLSSTCAALDSRGAFPAANITADISKTGNSRRSLAQSGSGFRFPTSGSFTIRATGSAFSGNTNFLINGPTTYQRLSDFSLSGTVIFSPASGGNGVNFALRIGNPLVGQAGATQFSTNTAGFSAFGGLNTGASTGVDVAKVTASGRTLTASPISDSTSRITQLGIFNIRSGLTASIYQIIRPSVSLTFNAAGQLTGGRLTVEGESLTRVGGGGTARVVATF